MLCWRVVWPTYEATDLRWGAGNLLPLTGNPYWHYFKMYTKIQIDRRKCHTSPRLLIRIVKKRPNAQP